MPRASALPSRPPTQPNEPAGLFGPAEPEAARIGEWLRRLALALTAALITARAAWPGEDADQGTGLLWVLGSLIVLALAVASWWTGGTTRLRLSWADLAVVGLVGLVGLSVSVAADRRPAVTMAWEWTALGIVYLLVRNLPRTPLEAVALGGGLIATACAVAAVGFFQIQVEDPQTRALYLKNPERALRSAGVADDPASRKRFEDRLLYSKEPRATFVLANSLAGFLVGPAVALLAVMLENLLNRQGRTGRWFPLILAAGPLLVLLGCLALTKSRSAYLGLGAGLLTIAWHERRAVSRRTILALGGLIALGLIALVVVAARAGHLDRLVLTESPKSLRYRVEYWQATWHLITGSPGRFLRGVGPGNFAGPYLRYKLPTSSEEIKDPHNLVLEVWASSGVLAVLALLAALSLTSIETLGRSRLDQADAIPPEAPPDYPGFEDAAPPRRTGWIWASAGIGGGLLAVLLGGVNPLADKSLVLAGAWILSAVLVAPIWLRRPIPGLALGAGVVAIVVNLAASGGISVPPVALGLWTLAALGLDLRDDRPCGRLRALPGRGLPLGLAFVVAALIGTYYGSNRIHWKTEAALSQAAAALQRRPPDWERARSLLISATSERNPDPRPWIQLAELEYGDWLLNGPKPSRNVGIKIFTALANAAHPPRNPHALLIQRLRIFYASELLRLQGDLLPAEAREFLQRERLNAAAKAVALYPTDAPLQGALAEAAAAVGRYGEAVRHAREALRLDAVTTHPDRKLPDALREQLRKQEAEWSAAVPPS